LRALRAREIAMIVQDPAAALNHHLELVLAMEVCGQLGMRALLDQKHGW
jgi:ABC-type dipeptide/oligopeptide/nickel transport system ATPase component